MSVNGNGCHVIALVGFILLMLTTATAINVSLGLDLNINVEFNGQTAVCKCNMRNTMYWKTPETGERCSAQVSNSTWITYDHTTSASLKPTPAETRPKITDIRIPTHLKPYHYRLDLHPNMTDPDPEKFTFKGLVNIHMFCYKATDKLYLHSKGLTVDPSKILFSGGPRYLSFTEDADREFLILQLDKNTTKGKRYTVSIQFTSPLKDDLKGLYYSNYTRNGKTVYLVTSYLKPTYARRVFPCFDEPAFKAVFDITLVRPLNYTSLSNMPLKRSKTIYVDGVTYVKDEFHWARDISTYLLAFVICDFTHIENRTENGVLFRVWSRHDVINMSYAFEVGSKVLPFYEKLFNVSFPLPKLDMVAVPYHETDGMENWGLMIIREDKMLTKGKACDQVATIVNQLIAHQWFGGLFSPIWWDDLWLNEGLVYLMANLGLDYFSPDWITIERLVLDIYLEMFISDSLVSSHPINRSVVDPSELKEVLDTITNRKTQAVIRMLRQFLGFDTFTRGMQRYFEWSKERGIASKNALWAHLTEQARIENKNINVNDVMDTWTLQMNFPLVTVSRDNSYGGALRVQQERFLENPNATDLGQYVSPFNYTWNIPITFASNKTRNFNESNIPIYWLWRNETSKLINASELLPSRDTWFICNINMNGYYRVNYDVSNWMAIARQLKEDYQVIPLINRIQIINDVCALSKRNILPYDTVFSILGYLENESEYLVWVQFIKCFTGVDLKTKLSLSPVYGLFQNFIQKMLKKNYQQVMNNTSNETTWKDIKNQMYTVALACYFELPECFHDARDKFKKWMDNPSNDTIDHHLEYPICCAAISNGDAKEWNFLIEMYKAERLHLVNLIASLGCTKMPWLLNRLLHMAIDEDSPIPKQSRQRIFFYASFRPIARSLSWNFFRANFNKLKEQFEASTAWLSIIKSVTEPFNTELELKELKAFKCKQDGNFGSGEVAMLEAIQKVEGNIQWMNTHYNTIADWLKANVK